MTCSYHVACEHFSVFCFVFYCYTVEDVEKILNEEDTFSLDPGAKLRDKVSYIGFSCRAIFLFRITSILLF